MPTLNKSCTVSSTLTTCVRCGYPITDLTAHFRQVSTAENVLATMHDLPAVCRNT